VFDLGENRVATKSRNFLFEELVCVGGTPQRIDRDIGRRSSVSELRDSHYFLLLSNPAFVSKSLSPNVARTAKISVLLSIFITLRVMNHQVSSFLENVSPVLSFLILNMK
jgi:hypothetical protein